MRSEGAMKPESREMSSEVKIASSFCSRVYRVERDGEVLAKKVFNSGWPIRVVYRLFDGGYLTQDGVKAAYEKRRIAHRLSRFHNPENFVVDAIGMCEDELGFYCPFVDGKPPGTKGELLYVREFLEGLEAFFGGIGMPTWSFGRYYSDPTWRLRRKNVLISPEGIRIVDYEEVVLVVRGGLRLGFDGLDLDLVGRFIREQRGGLEERLGFEEHRNLKEALERYGQCLRRSEVQPLRVNA